MCFLGAGVLVSDKLVLCWGADGVCGRYQDPVGSGLLDRAEPEKVPESSGNAI